MKKILVFLLPFLGMFPTLQAQNPCTNPPTVTITVDDSTPCLGDSITLTASGALNYSWNNNVMNGVKFAPSSSGTYQVIGTDALGCADTSDISIQVLDLPVLEANSSSLSICLGDSVELTASGGQSYTWINPMINNGDFYTPVDTGANVYIVNGEGANGCSNTSQVIVVVKSIPTAPTLNLNSISTCLNVDFDDQIVASVTEGRPLWYRDAALTNSYGTEPELVVSNSSVGLVEYYVSTFESGCFSAPVTATVEVFALPVINAGSDMTLTAGDRSSLSADAVSASSLSWEPQTGLSDPFSLNPQFTATNSETYSLTVTDANGCVSSDQMEVYVRNELIISNVMTPNGDGNNDVWKIYPEVVLGACKVKIFDGFGRLILETDNYRNDWDGTYKGSALPDGDYYYHIECDGVNEKGTIVIIN